MPALGRPAVLEGLAERTRTCKEATKEGLRLYVVGIPFVVDEQTLLLDFKECGPVEDIYLLRNAKGQSLGRGLVTFQNQESVKAAMKLSGTEYHGRPIHIKVSTEKQGQEQQESTEGKIKMNFPDERPEGCVSLCLKNIGQSTEADVRQFLKDCKPQAVRVILKPGRRTARGFAFVDFPEPAQVDKALEHNGEMLNGRSVVMKFIPPRFEPRPEGCMTVVVKQLSKLTEESDIRKLFKGLDSMSDLKVVRRNDRHCSGFAFVEFTKAEDVESAVKRSGMSVRGATALVRYETQGKVPEREAEKKEAQKKRRFKKVRKLRGEAEEFEEEKPEVEEEVELDGKKPKKKRKKRKESAVEGNAEGDGCKATANRKLKKKKKKETVPLDEKELAELVAEVSRFTEEQTPKKRRRTK